MTFPNIDVVHRPDAELREPILKGLMAFNERNVGAFKPEPMAVVLRNNKGEVIGGIWSIFIFEWLFIELLFIPEDLRGSGIGRHLMSAAEEEAKKRGCAGIRLDTYDFQAPGFYEKLGYKPYGTLDILPNGNNQTMYYKRLPKGTGNA